jgi:hypothetical protein
VPSSDEKRIMAIVTPMVNMVIWMTKDNVNNNVLLLLEPCENPTNFPIWVLA